jgi:hypothetical protein
MIQMGQGLESGSSCLYNADDQKDWFTWWLIFEGRCCFSSLKFTHIKGAFLGYPDFEVCAQLCLWGRCFHFLVKR